MKQKIITRRGLKTVDLNPRRAIRRHCHMCSDFSWKEVEACRTTECELYSFRPGADISFYQGSKERYDAIRDYCMERCSGGDEKKYLGCDMTTCPLYSFRRNNKYQQQVA